MKLIDKENLVWRKFQIPKITVLSRGNGKTVKMIEQVYQKGWNDAIDAILENEPVVEERQKGEWIKREEIFEDEEIPRLVWGCKECGFSLKSIHDKRNYCPNCGAQMFTGGDTKND